MARKRKAAISETAAEDHPVVAEAHADPLEGLTEMERERARIIERNRARLAALGIPGLVAALDAGAGGGGRGKSKAAGKKRAPRVKKEKGEAAGEEQPTRRSRRLHEAEEHPQVKKEEEETAEEAFKRELGLFAVEGECPRCGRLLQRGHKAHLANCTGRAAGAARRAGAGEARAPREDALQDLSESERRDKRKVLEARMKQLHLDALVELSNEAAKFVVLGSRGNNYTVALTDDKHTCQCMDYRFRRHNCKHIMLVLSQLGCQNTPKEWRQAVESRMDELLEQRREREAMEARTTAVPPSKSEQVALRML